MPDSHGEPDFPGKGLLGRPGQPPNAFERYLADRMLSATLDFPKEFKTWVPQWVGSEPEVIPIGSLSGSIPLSKISGLPSSGTEGQLPFWDADTGAYVLGTAPTATGEVPIWDASGEDWVPDVLTPAELDITGYGDGEFIMSNGSGFVDARPIQVVSTIAQLDAYPGAMGRVDLGGSATNFLTVYYDDGDTAWYTDTVLQLNGTKLNSGLPGGAAWTNALIDGVFGARAWVNWRDPHNAGLRPQFRCMVLADGDSGQTISGGVRLQRGNDDSSLGAATSVFAETVVTNVGSGNLGGERGTWVNAPSIGSIVDAFMVEVMARRSGSNTTGNLQDCTVEMRWRDGNGT